jgi:membrane protease YdiL (CAAX protease family)
LRYSHLLNNSTIRLRVISIGYFMDILVLLACLGFIIIIANLNYREQSGKNTDDLKYPVNVFLYLLWFVIALLVLLNCVELYLQVEQFNITVVLAIISSFIVLGFMFMMIYSFSFRKNTMRNLRLYKYNPYSAVHTVAVILMVGYTLINIVGTLTSGGLQGVSEDIQSNTLNIWDLVMNLVIHVILAVMGVGLFIRRNPKEVLKRLGLELPTWRQILMGVLVGAFLYLLTIPFGIIWQNAVGLDTFEQQTSAARQLGEFFTSSLLVGFLMAFTASVGEEILYRGAIQPIFGNFITVLFFTVSHSQYFFTPTWLMIFLVGITFGILRTRFNTTTAIFAHFTYNFIPVLLVLLLSELS